MKVIKIVAMLLLLLITCFLFGCTEMPADLHKEFLSKSINFPYIQRLDAEGLFDEVIVNNPNGLVLLRFFSPDHAISNYTYFGWSRTDSIPLQGLTGNFWTSRTQFYNELLPAEKIMIPPDGIALNQGPDQSLVIFSVSGP